MAANTFGHLFRLTTFGESHGTAIGGIVEGCPTGIPIDLALIQQDLDRRRPGQSSIVTQRKELDQVEILSGLFEGLTTGTPIGLLIRNETHRPQDYDHLQHAYRPSHADFTYDQKYGHRDYRGGGRSSARETAIRVAAGSIAKQLLAQYGVKLTAYVSQVGHLTLHKPYQELDFGQIEQNPLRCPDSVLAAEMEQLIREVRKEGDTLGGVITGVIQGLPSGLGEPVFDKFHAQLGKAMLSINAVKGFEYGSGFAGTQLRGSQHNDLFHLNAESQQIQTLTNHSGGIQGGITNGMDVYFRVAFKPVATLMRDQQTVNDKGEEQVVTGKGRHDVCVVPRAVPIVEAMAALVSADFLLWQRVQHRT